MQWDPRRADSRAASMRLAEHARSLHRAEGYIDVTQGPVAVALAWGVVVRSHSCVRLFATPWTTYSTPGFPIHHHLPELALTHLH